MTIARNAEHGRNEPAEQGSGEKNSEEKTGLHHHVVVGHRPFGGLRTGIAVLRGRLVEQVVELLVGHDRFIASGLDSLIESPVHHGVTHGRDPFDLSRLLATDEMPHES